MIAETNRTPLELSREEFASGRAGGVERPNLEDFEGIYHQYSKRVYSLCLRLTGNDADAQDLTQEAFIHLFRKLDTFRGESSFYTWFYRLALNIVLMQLRRKQRLMETSLEAIMEPDCYEGLLPREIRAADTKLFGTIDKVYLQHALAHLPTGFRVAFVLHDIEGYKHSEISEMVGCSVGASKSQLHRARLRLRKLLTRCPCQQAPVKQFPAGDILAAAPSMPSEALVAA